MLNNLLGKQGHTLETSLKILCDIFKVVTFMFFYTAGVSLKQNKKTYFRTLLITQNGSTAFRFNRSRTPTFYVDSTGTILSSIAVASNLKSKSGWP